MIDIPEALRDLRFQHGGLDNTAMLLKRMAELRHSRDISHWALYEHIKADRVRLYATTFNSLEVFDPEAGGQVIRSPRDDDVVINAETEGIIVKATNELWLWWETQLNECKDDSQNARTEKPSWDRSSLTLTFGGEVVKVFKRGRSNQTTILDFFEMDGWPTQLDDPLECPKFLVQWL